MVTLTACLAMAAYRDSRRRTSVAWDHFEIKDAEKCTATCNHCLDSFSYRTSVSNLMKHLRAKHSFTVVRESEDDNTDCEEGSGSYDKIKSLKSELWTYFDVRDEENKLAVCNTCSEECSYEAGLGELLKHMQDTHEIQFKEEQIENKVSDDETDVDRLEKRYNGESRRTNSSIAWDFFTVSDRKNKVATCNLCSAVCSYKTSVSNLTKHALRKHNLLVYKDDGNESGDNDTNIRKETNHKGPRSIVWLYFKCVDPESKLSQCLICKKLLSHATSITNLKKHLERRHPNVKIPGREDGSKRILLSSGGELYEVETGKSEELNDYNDNQNETIEMDTVYLEDFDSLDPDPQPKKQKQIKTATKRKRVHFAYDSSSESEITFKNKYIKKKSDALDHFGRYIASLLKQLPKQISNQLQTDFVKQIMNAQLTLDTQSRVTDTQSNAYQITITADQDTGDTGEVTEFVKIGEMEDKNS